MALLSKWVESLDYEYEILSSCTRHRSHHSTCTKCVETCEKQAISINNGKPLSIIVNVYSVAIVWQHALFKPLQASFRKGK